MAVFKDNAWAFYKLPFYSEFMDKDAVTNSIYFLFEGNNGGGLYKYNGGNYADSSGYTFISEGGKNGIGEFSVYNNKIYAAKNGGIGNPADSNTIGILVQDANGTAGYFSYPDWVNTYSMYKEFDGLATTNGNDLVMYDDIYQPNVFGTGVDADLFFLTERNGQTCRLQTEEELQSGLNFLPMQMTDPFGMQIPYFNHSDWLNTPTIHLLILTWW